MYVLLIQVVFFCWARLTGKLWFVGRMLIYVSAKKYFLFAYGEW